MAIRQLNYEKVRQTLIEGISRYVGSKKAIIGISGGVDSALTATLCVAALGKENVLSLLLPYGNQVDISDSIDLVSWLGIESKTIDIKPIVNQYPFSEDQLVMANIMSRTRMTVLYAFANLNHGLVIGTTNKSEMAIGYFTKYGDGGVDFEPIADIYKTEVWQLAKLLDIPDQIISKEPTAGLWDGQTDQSEMGFSYQELDNFLQGEKVDDELVSKIKRLINSSEHKRHLPPTILLF